MDMLNVSHIQHFSTGDGPGIRTTVFLKGCNLRCPWCHNPETISSLLQTLHFAAAGQTQTFGARMSVEQVVAEVLEDADFYLVGGGGVTLSGGEPLLQAEGVSKVARELRARGISVVIDTAGCVSYTAFQRLNPIVSGYLFDFKTADAEKYRRIGGNLDLVTQNLYHLKADNVPFRIRIPLIPGFNTDPASVKAIGEHLKGMGIREAELLPFHRLGSAKYEAMGLDYAYRDQAPLSAEALETIEGNYKKYISLKIER